MSRAKTSATPTMTVAVPRVERLRSPHEVCADSDDSDADCVELPPLPVGSSAEETDGTAEEDEDDMVFGRAVDATAAATVKETTAAVAATTEMVAAAAAAPAAATTTAPSLSQQETADGGNESPAVGAAAGQKRKRGVSGISPVETNTKRKRPVRKPKSNLTLEQRLKRTDVTAAMAKKVEDTRSSMRGPPCSYCCDPDHRGAL
ncbi:hypothetical protein PINS_up010188 [Pythium insidiosum]|nr:hypothetical protein PINS_up010188 [Pythium insidiosum]